MRCTLDLDPDRDGKPIRGQVLRPGVAAPVVADVIDTVANQVVRFTVPLDAAMGEPLVAAALRPPAPRCRARRGAGNRSWHVSGISRTADRPTVSR